MSVLFALALGGAILHVARNPSARRTVLLMLRSAAVLANLADSDFGMLQRQVLVGARRRRTTAVNGLTRLPVRYLVTFATSDEAHVAPVRDVFFGDIADVLTAEARAHDWVLAEAPRFHARFVPEGRPGFPSVEALPSPSDQHAPGRAAEPTTSVARPRHEPIRTCRADAGLGDLDATRPAPGPAPRAALLRNARTGATIPLGERDRIVVGRSQPSDVLVDEPSVSGRHAELVRARSGWTITDCASTNGTWVNDRPASGPTVLAPGDVVRLGPEVSFVLEA